MLDLSVIVNVDTRPENSQNKEMFNGVVDRDFLTDGIKNKLKAFDGFDKELIVFVDEHEPIGEKDLLIMKSMCDTLVIRKHNKKFEEQENFAAFNDFNYIQALSQARGRYIFHMDGDTAIFSKSKQSIQEIIDLLEKYDYVSYPSMWSPNPVEDDSFGGKYWASTRFFACKRSTIDISELIKCQLDYDYWKTTYPVPRLCHWLEHLCSSIAWNKGNGVHYPPIDLSKLIFFTWANYNKYTFARLNNQSFEEVRDWVLSKHYHYPCDLTN